MAQISRADAAALISEQKAFDIVQSATESSVVLTTFKQIPMLKKELKTPVASTLPQAGFVDEATGSSGVKPTSTVAWSNKSLVAEEIAVIVPVHEDVLADADVDLWAQIQPLVAQSFGYVLDNAVLYGTNAPSSWTDADLVAKAVAASQSIERGAAGGNLAADINLVFAKLEEAGFDVTNIFAHKKLRAMFRGLTDTTGQPIYLNSIKDDGNVGGIYGADVRYLNSAVANATEAELIAVDAEQYRVGIREDFTVKFLDQATVGGINLAERDMVAMRFKFRVGFAKVGSAVGHGSAAPVAILQNLV